MKQFFLLILSFFVGITAFSQIMVDVDCAASDYKSGKNEAGVTVRVYEGSTVVASGTTGSNGKAPLMKVPDNKIYKVEFSKPGKITRFVELNAKDIDVELLQSSTSPLMFMKMTMIDENPDVDFSYVKDNPATEFYFDGKNPQLAYDDIISDKMKKKITSIMADAEKKSGQADAQYQAAIKAADGLLAQKKYSEALTKYEEAARLKPKEKYPSDKIVEIDEILQAQKKSELANQQENEVYNNLIKAADMLRDQKKYSDAISKYNEALTKKTEQYPKDQVAAITALVDKEKKDAENEAKYKEAITAADGFFGQKSWLAAKEKYTLASKLKVAEAYPKTKLAEIEAKLKAQEGAAATKKKYDDAIAAGDELFKAEKWVESKAKYAEAIAVEAGATYPKEKITEIDAKLAEVEKNKLKQQQIAKLLAEGGTAFTALQWEPAKLKYAEVLKLEAANPEATAKLAEIEAKLTEQKNNAAQEANFKKLVLEGDALVKQVKLADAVTKYEAALAVKKDPAVEQKVADLNKQILAAKEKEVQKGQYDAAIKEGEALLTKGDLEGAKAKFTQASLIDASQKFPKDKLAGIELLIAENNKKLQKSQQYDLAMEKADNLFTAGKLVEAKASYTEASALDAANTAPKEKIKQIDGLLAAEAKTKAKLEQYTAAMKAGDELLGAGKLGEAKAKFNEAATLDPAQSLPQQKIAQIDAQLETEASAKAKTQKYNAAMQEGEVLLTAGKLEEAKAKFTEATQIDATQKLPKDKIAAIDLQIAENNKKLQKGQQFDLAMKAGDALLAAGKLAEAKSKYTEAATLDAASNLPKDKIKQVDALLEAEAKTKSKLQQYTAAMKAGDDLLAAGKLVDAKTKFNEAATLDPLQALPKEKIKEIDALIESESKTKAKSQQYTAAMKAGDDLLSAGKLTEAKNKYTEAAALDATQNLPKQKIAQIDAQLAEQANAAAQKTKIDGLLKEANALLAKSELEKAKSKYQEILALNPTQPEALAGLQEVTTKLNAQQSQAQKDAQFATLKAQGTALMAQEKWLEAKTALQEAKTIKADAEIDQKLATINEKLAAQQANAATEAAYNKSMQEAQTAESAKNLDLAIAKYKEASAMKPNEALPKTKITDLELQKKQLSGQADVDAKYKAAMVKANAAYDGQKYIEAIKLYNEALLLKPNEEEPVRKAAEAERLEKAKFSEADEQYLKILNAGQRAIDEKNWAKAKDMYNRAIKFKPEDEVPKLKLTEIDNLMLAEENSRKELVEKDKNYAAKIAEAELAVKGSNYDKAITLLQQAAQLKPEEKLAVERLEQVKKQKASAQSVAEQDKLYADFMKNGNAALEAKAYPKALSEYQNALNVRSGDKVAADKMSEVQQILDNLSNADAEQQKKADFQAVVKEADQLFAKQSWAEAKIKYEEARKMDPADAYVKKQIDKSVANEKSKGATEKEYQTVIAKADASFKAADYKKALELYERASTLKTAESYPKEKAKEIDAILHPPVAAAPMGPLPTLGTPTDNSLVEGENALRKAEQQRKAKRSTRFRKGVDQITDQETERSEAKNQNIVEASNIIEQADKERSEKVIENEENKLKMIQSVHNNTMVLENEAKASSNMKYAENLNVNDKMRTIEKENAVQYTVSEGVYTDNTAALKVHDQEMNKQNDVAVNQNYVAQIETQGALNKVDILVSEKAIDDAQARLQTEEDVKVKAAQVARSDADNQATADVKITEAEGMIKAADALRMGKTQEDSKMAAANEVSMIDVQKAVSSTDADMEVKNQEGSLVIQENIIKTNARVSEATATQDDQRLESVVTLDAATEALEASQRNNYNQQLIKVMANQEEVTNQKAINTGVAELEKARSDKNIADVGIIDKSAELVRMENNLNDDEQRRRTKADITAGDRRASETVATNDEASANNTALLNKASNSLHSEASAEQNRQKDANIEARAMIEKISGSQMKFDDKVANALGAEFPEGVSQESFNRMDEEGLLVSVVTRRVVVRNGYGQIYIRTQSLDGITYTKNGAPSTEYVWQRETQDAKLVRNY
jgi:epidermal growth factor receptor substrate 15